MPRQQAGWPSSQLQCSEAGSCAHERHASFPLIWWTRDHVATFKTDIFRHEGSIPEPKVCAGPGAKVSAVIESSSPICAKCKRRQPEDDAEYLEPKDSPGIVEFGFAAEADSVVTKDDQGGRSLVAVNRDHAWIPGVSHGEKR